VVSFSGLDGAGKTRQIDALIEAIGEEHDVELRWIPFKIWPEGLLNKLPAGFRSRLGPQRSAAPATPSPVSVKTSRPTTSTARRALWWGIGTMASVSGGLSLRRRAAHTSAEVLVLDRYRLDAAVKLQFWYPDVSARWLARVVDSLAPAPDLQFLLRVPPEVAYARKPEQWSVRQLARQARLYDDLAQARDVVVLDAEEDPERIAAAVEAQIRQVLDGR
jgi:thymidylate kinase